MICKQIISHFSENKILTPVQHGFRSKHSCESQLLITTDEFIQNFESKTQTDVVVLNFSKAFDVVPHRRLLTTMGFGEQLYPWLEFSSGSCHRIKNCGSVQESTGWLNSPALSPLQPDTPNRRCCWIIFQSSKIDDWRAFTSDVDLEYAN